MESRFIDLLQLVDLQPYIPPIIGHSAGLEMEAVCYQYFCYSYSNKRFCHIDYRKLLNDGAWKSLSET